jgi:hypothetical protein
LELPKKTGTLVMGGATGGALFGNSQPAESDVALLINRWPTLPEATKAAVMKLVKTASSAEERGTPASSSNSAFEFVHRSISANHAMPGRPKLLAAAVDQFTGEFSALCQRFLSLTPPEYRKEPPGDADDERYWAANENWFLWNDTFRAVIGASLSVVELNAVLKARAASSRAASNSSPRSAAAPDAEQQSEGGVQ